MTQNYQYPQPPQYAKYTVMRACILPLILLPVLLYMPISHAEEGDQTAIQQGIRLYNQAKIKQAKAVFKEEADKGSATATYWLGIAQYESSEHFQAGTTFLKAARMGDPWAMDLLVPGGNSPCDYLGWPCDEAWHEKAMAGWAQLAAKGDGKAKYAMHNKGDKWWQYIPFYRQKVRNEIYDDIMQHKGYGILKHGAIWETDEQLTNYLIMAAEDGYAPAMHSLFYADDFIGREKANEWLFKALQLGYARAAKSLSYAYRFNKHGFEQDYVKAYYYHRLQVKLGDRRADSSWLTETIKDECGGGGN